MSATLKLGELAKGSTRLADLLAEGQSSVRSDPANAKRRVMLFQLMVLSGQWDRALTQLYVIKEMDRDAEGLATVTWAANELLDKLGLYTMEVYQRSRDQVIARQQEELLELSTPVVKLWDGILALPMIGTLDSARTQVVMESLLQRIVETGAAVAIIDITGVPTVDTLTAQHLLKTVTAARLMGADCIISGIRPQIAQTIVHLGIDLQGIATKASLADALTLAMEQQGFVITRSR